MKNGVMTIIAMLSLGVLLACGGEETAVTQPVASQSASGDVASNANTYRRDEPATATLTGIASRTGDVMPSYSANDLNGGTWKLSEEKGITMLNLWATWCGPCRYEIPALIELQEEFGDRGLQVVGVSMDRAGMEEQITTFARNAGINYKVVHDPNAVLADVFDTTIIPTTALIDRDGKIVWYHAGIVSGDDPELLEALEAALAEV